MTNFYSRLSKCLYLQSVTPVTFIYISFPKQYHSLNTVFRLFHSYAEISNIFCKINYDCQNFQTFRVESHVDFHTQSIIMTLGSGTGGRGLSLMMLWNSEKLSNFKAHELSWTVNELCTGILILSSSCPPIAQIHRWTLWKIHPSAVFSSKIQHRWQKKTHTHTHTPTHTHTHTHTQATRQRKLEISSYNIQL